MNIGLVASFLGVTALWMALVALGTGALASFLTAPIAVGLGALALALRRDLAATIRTGCRSGPTRLHPAL